MVLPDVAEVDVVGAAVLDVLPDAAGEVDDDPLEVVAFVDVVATLGVDPQAHSEMTTPIMAMARRRWRPAPSDDLDKRIRAPNRPLGSSSSPAGVRRRTVAGLDAGHAIREVWKYTDRRQSPVPPPIPLHCAGIHADQIGARHRR